MRIAEVITAPRSPWQNAYVERLIGSIRRECLDHVIVFNERHLLRVLSSYADYYPPFEDAPVCGELLIFDTNQQFATHRIWLYRAWPRCLNIMVLVKPAKASASFGAGVRDQDDHEWITKFFDVVVEPCCIPTAALMGRVNFALVLNACELFSTGGDDSEAEDDRSARGVSG
jgi:hypothetical protein